MKTKGEIISISDVETLTNGAKKLHFQIDTKEKYDNIISFNLYKGEEHLKHIENFTFNTHVGDMVEVEFNIKCREYNGKWYTNLDMWRIEKIDKAAHDEIVETLKEQADDDLPF